MANDDTSKPIPESMITAQPDDIQSTNILDSKANQAHENTAVLSPAPASLTDKQLEQWFAALERTNTDRFDKLELEEDDEGLAIQFLSRFGMESPVDVAAFLKSPGGEAMTAMIREEIAEMEAMEDYDQFLAQEESKREHRLLGFLLLALMYESDAEADSLNEIIAAQNEQRHARAAASHTPVDDAAIEYDVLTQQNEAFKSAIDAVNNKLELKTNELKTAEKNIDQLQQQKQEMDAEHHVFDRNITELHDFLASVENTENQPKLIEQRITSLQTAMNKLDEEIKSLIEEGKDYEVKQKITERLGLELQMDGLREMQEVLKGEKHCCDAEGNPTTSPKDAQLVLNKGTKIVKDPADGRCHLLGANEDLQDIKASANGQERLRASHGHYQQALKESTSVRAKVADNKQLREEYHAQRHSEALAQRDTIKGHISQLTTQKTKLQTAQAEVQERIVQARLSAPNESPSPNMRPSLKPQPQSTNKPSQNPVDELIAAINQLKKDRSPAAFKRVDDLARPFGKHPQFNSFVDKIEEIKNMPRFAPIPQVTMNSLLQNIERFGVSAEKPNVATLDAKHLDKTLENEPEEQAATLYQTPTTVPTPRPR